MTVTYGEIHTLLKEYRRTRKGMKDKRNHHGMAQWVNCLWNNIFVNPQPLSLLCEISGALHLALLGLMGGADKILVNFENFRIHYRSRYSSFALFNKCIASF